MMRKLMIAMAMGFLISVVCSMAGFAEECDGIRQSVLRLHVLANSDTEADQALKLKVRDRVLAESSDLFCGASSEEDARSRADAALPRIRDAAADEIQKQGYDYPVDVRLANIYFGTRQYETVTLPAGYYDAVQVQIGDAAGRNWWCVMFPPMCLPAAEESETLDDVLNDAQMDIVEGGVKYEVKFKVIEWFEGIKQSIWGS